MRIVEGEASGAECVHASGRRRPLKFPSIAALVVGPTELPGTVGVGQAIDANVPAKPAALLIHGAVGVGEASNAIAL